MSKKPKLIVILGPTTTGKSDLAIKLARKFHGEIISADSRQVYRGLNLGTGKVTRREQKLIPHHLLDVASPKTQFSVADFKHLAKLTIVKIIQRERIPFLVGGSAFWIYAVIDDLAIPEVKPNLRLRGQLAKKSTEKLFQMLEKLDPVRAAQIDPHNPRRLIRAIEIIKSTGRAIPTLARQASPYDLLILGIKKNQAEIYSLIDDRLEKRIQKGLIREVKKLLGQKVTHKRLQELGLEYRFVSLYLQKKLTYDQMQNQLKNAIHKFARRQMTWFKTDRRIKWIKNKNQAADLIKKFTK